MSITTVRNFRRASQIVFFVFFFWLILKTNFNVDFTVSKESGIDLPYPVSLFLQFDPLTALGTLLTSWTVYEGLLWSLVILIPTIFLGRFFCGWICPMGTLNHWISEIRSERIRHRGKGKIESNRYKKYQRIKYYIFLFFIGAALMGSLQIGLLDPLPFLARSIGTVVLPTIQSAALGVVAWVKSIGYPPLGDAAQSVYDAVSPLVLNYRPVHFHAILTIGLLFAVVLLLNRLFTRFWCRGICPLGAMLGVFSRYAIFGLQKDEAKCTRCGLCNLHCQGEAITPTSAIHGIRPNAICVSIVRPNAPRTRCPSGSFRYMNRPAPILPRRLRWMSPDAKLCFRFWAASRFSR